MLVTLEGVKFFQAVMI
jgi:phospholipid-transporting ATPase